jgi:hypothetical protein
LAPVSQSSYHACRKRTGACHPEISGRMGVLLIISMEATWLIKLSILQQASCSRPMQIAGPDLETAVASAHNAYHSDWRRRPVTERELPDVGSGQSYRRGARRGPFPLISRIITQGKLRITWSHVCFSNLPGLNCISSRSGFCSASSRGTSPTTRSREWQGLSDGGERAASQACRECSSASTGFCSPFR